MGLGSEKRGVSWVTSPHVEVHSETQRRKNQGQSQVEFFAKKLAKGNPVMKKTILSGQKNSGQGRKTSLSII